MFQRGKDHLGANLNLWLGVFGVKQLHLYT